MIEPTKKAEYAELLQSEQGKKILLLAGFGQKDTIMKEIKKSEMKGKKEKVIKNSLLDLMADVLHPERQNEIYFHPNSRMKPIDLTQSTHEALEGACKDVKFNLSEILDSKEMTKVKRIKG